MEKTNKKSLVQIFLVIGSVLIASAIDTTANKPLINLILGAILIVCSFKILEN